MRQRFHLPKNPEKIITFGHSHEDRSVKNGSATEQVLMYLLLFSRDCFPGNRQIKDNSEYDPLAAEFI